MEFHVIYGFPYDSWNSIYYMELHLRYIYIYKRLCVNIHTYEVMNRKYILKSDANLMLCYHVYMHRTYQDMATMENMREDIENMWKLY